jgi:AcrR family transcriptional regulator
VSARRDVRTRLLQAATKLFAEQGFEGTSVQSIVERAGVTKGALYHYFDSKDDLLHEIYARVLRMQTEHLLQIAESDLPLAERVRQAAADVVETSVANLDDTVIFFRSMHLLGAGRRAQVRAERRRYHESFRALVQQGQDSGEFRADVPAELVVDYFFGAVHHLDAWYRRRGHWSGRDIGWYFADLLMASLRP